MINATTTNSDKSGFSVDINEYYKSDKGRTELRNLKTNRGRRMKKYQITIMTIYGSLTIDDIEAKNEKQAIQIAEKKAHDALDCAKIDEVYCYE